jgi:protein phosphatase
MEPRLTPENPLSSPFRAPASRPALHIEVAACTDAGLSRADNQDSYLVIEPSSADPWALFAVCDGMGGAAGGDVASRTAVEALREVMKAGGAPATGDALGRRLLRGVDEASRRIFAVARRRPQLKGMGTTATACALAGDWLYLAQVGDSRAYLLREGRLTKLTRDQTLATLLVEQGQLAPEDVETFPLGHVILQAVGTTERVQVDLTRVRVARGDVLLVCSDGLHGPVPHATLRATLEGEPSAEAAAQALVRLALAAGGPDNVTCIVAKVGGRALAPPAGLPAPEKARLDEDTTSAPDHEAAPEQVQRGASGDDGAEASPRGPAPAADEDQAMGIVARFAAVFRRRKKS